MNWINNVVRPKIQGIWAKRELPENKWIKCPETGRMVYHKDLEANLFVVPESGFHMRIAAKPRLQSFFDQGEFDKIEVASVPHDPLKFKDQRRYADRLKDARSKTGLDDAVLLGEGALEGQRVVAAVQDFSFMGGSLGMAAGQTVVTGMMRAVELKTPFIIFAASGGARMQEGILSLMQMPRTTVAIQQLRAAKLPYIVVLTHPTTGGVTASYAMLGDVQIAEPGALICFAGPRVIEQTIREKLPEGFQRSEYLLEKGMVDMVVHRHDLRSTIARICRLLAPKSTGKKEQADIAGQLDKPSSSFSLPMLPDEQLDLEPDLEPDLKDDDALLDEKVQSAAEGQDAPSDATKAEMRDPNDNEPAMGALSASGEEKTAMGSPPADRSEP